MIDNLNITYEVLDFNSVNGNITVKIYCDKFKHSSEFYPEYNINILDINTTKDIKNQLTTRCLQIVNQILAREDEDARSIVNKFVESHKHVKLSLENFQKESLETDTLPKSSFFDVIKE